MPQKHLAGRSHSVFVFIAGHRGNLAKDRRYLETSVSCILANLLKREQRIATVAALIVYGKKNQVLTQTVEGRPRNGQRGRPGKRLVFVKQSPNGCSCLSCALGIGCENLGEQPFSCVSYTRFIQR